MTVRFEDAVLEQVPAADTLVYTAPAACKSAQIIFANCTCEDAVADSISVNIVQSGATAAATNIYVKSKAIAAGETSSLSEIVGAVLKPGDFVSAIAATIDRLNLKIGVKEIY